MLIDNDDIIEQAALKINIIVIRYVFEINRNAIFYCGKSKHTLTYSISLSNVQNWKSGAHERKK